MAEAARRGGRPLALIGRLVLADLRHEWLLSLCMILAIASILAPLLILFGLKFGTIETFRQRLLEDPKNREMRPLSSRPYEREWFAEVGAWPGVAFVIPYTRQMSAGLDAYPEAAAAAPAPVTLDVIPSGPGDVWLTTFGLPIPGAGQAALSAPAAEALGARAGQKLRVAVKKILGSRIEQAETELEIVGVFQEGGPERPAIFTTLAFLEQVEAYKDGRAVPELGWPGVAPLARPVFTAALLKAPDRLDPVMEYRTINNTGFVAVKPVTTGEAAAFLGRAAEPGHYYLLETKGEPARADNVLTLAELFRGTEAAIYPLAESLSVTLSGGGGSQKFTLVPGAALSEPDRGLLNGSLDSGLPPEVWQCLMVAPGQWPVGESLLTFTGQAGSVSFPVQVAETPELADSVVAAPLTLLGLLAQADRRALSWEPESRALLLGRRSYAGFRLYAATLEDVAPLQKKFAETGLTVAAETARIEEVKRLDRYLSLIFWLISVGAIIGATASLLSNIYAGLERKRRELGVLRLLGVSGFAFLRFPLYSSVLLTAGGFFSSWLMFTALSAIINHLFRDQLRAGESLCRLAGEHLAAALAVSLAVAAVAGLAAAVRAARIEPSEALRDE